MSQPQPDLPRTFLDHALREALVQPDNLHELLHRVIPEIAGYLDYTRLEVLPRTYLLDDWRERELDVLVRLPYLTGAAEQEVLIAILIEHQSYADETMPLRLLLGAVLFWEQQWRGWKAQHQRGQPLRLTPVFPIVLHTGERGWSTNRALADLFPETPTLRATAPQWQTWLWDLVEHPPAELLAGEEAFWQTLAVVRAEHADSAEFAAVLAEVLGRLEAIGRTNRVRWERLLQIVLHWALFRRPREEHVQILATVQAAQRDALLKAEVTTVATQMKKNYEQELIERYFAQGAEAGETRGEAKGRLEESRAILQRLLEKRFGQVPKELVQRIASADLAVLKAALDQVLTLQKLDDLQL